MPGFKPTLSRAHMVLRTSALVDLSTLLHTIVVKLSSLLRSTVNSCNYTTVRLHQHLTLWIWHMYFTVCFHCEIENKDPIESIMDPHPPCTIDHCPLGARLPCLSGRRPPLGYSDCNTRPHAAAAEITLYLFIAWPAMLIRSTQLLL